VIDRAWVEAQLVEIRKSKDQLRANLNATEGAEQLCQKMLAEGFTDASAEETIEEGASRVSDSAL
jgi:hypothetical protein